MAYKSNLLKFQGTSEPSSLTKKRVVISKADIKDAGGLDKDFEAKYGTSAKEKKNKIVVKMDKQDFFDPKYKPLKGKTQYFTGTGQDDKPLPSAEGAGGYEGVDPSAYQYKRFKRREKAYNVFEKVAQAASLTGAGGMIHALIKGR